MKIVFSSKEVAVAKEFKLKFFSMIEKTAEKICIVTGKNPEFAKTKAKEFLNKDIITVSNEDSGASIVEVDEKWVTGFIDKFGETVCAWIDVGFNVMVSCLPLAKIAMFKHKELGEHMKQLTKEDF